MEENTMNSKISRGLRFTYFFTFAMLLFGTTAMAYIDPAATSYLIQIIAGVFIAGGAAIGVYWTKFKRKVSGKSKADEDDTRENVEFDDINDEL